MFLNQSCYISYLKKYVNTNLSETIKKHIKIYKIFISNVT